MDEGARVGMLKQRNLEGQVSTNTDLASLDTSTGHLVEDVRVEAVELARVADRAFHIAAWTVHDDPPLPAFARHHHTVIARCRQVVPADRLEQRVRLFTGADLDLGIEVSETDEELIAILVHLRPGPLHAIPQALPAIAARLEEGLRIFQLLLGEAALAPPDREAGAI